MNRKELSKKELREQYVATQAIIIQAFGRVGAYLYENIEPSAVQMYVSRINKINWKRSCDVWKRRVMRNDGRIINNENAILYANNYIKMTMGIPLTQYLIEGDILR